MSLFDFFFPGPAAASHLHAMRDQHAESLDAQRLHALREATTSEALKMRIDKLESDMGFVVMLLGSLISTLDEKGVVTRDDLKKELADLDVIDGTRDGKLKVNVLKKYMDNTQR